MNTYLKDFAKDIVLHVRIMNTYRPTPDFYSIQHEIVVLTTDLSKKPKEKTKKNQGEEGMPSETCIEHNSKVNS